MAISFTNRSADVEIMDDLLCEGEVVDQTLRELDFINHWLGGNAVTLQALTLVWNGIPKIKRLGLQTWAVAVAKYCESFRQSL
jgi:hypothetical protein